MSEPPRPRVGNYLIGGLAMVGLAAMGCLGISTLAVLLVGARLADRLDGPAAAPVAVQLPPAPAQPAWLTGTNAEPSGPHISGLARVIDGDTLDVGGVRIRLHGIDAPESGQTCLRADGLPYDCGQAATATLLGAVGLAQVRCYRYDTDHYGRTVAKCWVGTDSLNAAMVAIGWAMAYRDYSMDYVDEESFAQRARMGMWAGRFDAPWDWRRR